MRRSRTVWSAAALAVLAGCVPRPQQTLAPPPPPPRASPPPMAQPVDWMDWPVTPGNWTYVPDGRWTIARFVAPGSGVAAWVRCDTADRTVTIGHNGATGESRMMTVRTTFGVLQWPAQPATGGTAKGMGATRAAQDPGLDRIAFSRGRFTIELPGLPPLVLPTWAEPVRVIEDCRG